MIVADLAECYEKHGEALVRFAASLVGPHHADDVVAAAVLGVLQRGTDGIHDLRAYLYRGVANAGSRHWRGVDRRRRRDEAITALTPRGQAEPDHADGLADDELAAAMADLSVQQRAVVHLTYWEDLTPAAVAARLAVSEGTVRRQLARARQRLRSTLDA